MGVHIRAAVKHEQDTAKDTAQVEIVKRLTTLYDMRVAQHAKDGDFKKHASSLTAQQHKAAITDKTAHSNRDRILARQERLKHGRNK